ncbi:MAG: hypothetical protein ABI610_13125 [Acidobacteriota bacterium]
MRARAPVASSGYLLVEAVVATLLFAALLVAALGLWDSASRLNRSEIDVAEAQGGVRYGLRQMGRVVGMAGSGGLFVTQAVLLRPDPDLPGVVAPPDGDYDNVVGGSVTDWNGRDVPVRPGTDVLEVRGVFFSPLLAYDGETGCGPCTGVSELRARAVTSSGHVNDEPARRPQFALIDSHAAGASARNPLFVVVSEEGDLHSGCSDPPDGKLSPAQPAYRVGLLEAPPALAAAGTFGRVDFASALARELESEDPRDRAPSPAPPPGPVLTRGGVLDDVLFFIDDTDPRHPVLAQALRRGRGFDVVPLVEDVEDLQVAYGVDGLYGSDGVLPDGALGRLSAPTAEDPDPHFSSRANGDEWAPNAEGERVFANADLQSLQPPPAGFPHDDASRGAHCPTLSAVLFTLVAKTRDPDPTFRGPGSSGFRVMNSAGESRVYPPSPGEPRYRRRSSTLRVNLRNYEPAR